MLYRDEDGDIDTPKKILRVNHAGEFGAVNIYRSQILVCKVFMRDLVPVLNSFLSDEQRHLEIFWKEIQARNGIRCRSYWLCGFGGFFLGLITALLGRRGIMACTWAVESVVIDHLEEQLRYLEQKGDTAAYDTVRSIVEDEKDHKFMGFLEGGTQSMWYAPLRYFIGLFTEGVIRFGMR